MLIHAAEPLFAWGQLEDCPTLSTIRDALQAVPDEQLLDGLRAARGHGRDDYPVKRLWHVVLLTVLLRHHSFEECLAELHRNPSRADAHSSADSTEVGEKEMQLEYDKKCRI